jgi:hypothetical protein
MLTAYILKNSAFLLWQEPNKTLIILLYQRDKVIEKISCRRMDRKFVPFLFAFKLHQQDFLGITEEKNHFQKN